jgi:hypothetical protein
MFRSCSEGLAVVVWIRLISLKRVSSYYCIHMLSDLKIRSGTDAIGSLQPIPGRSNEPITARTNLYKYLCLQEFHESHLPDQVQDQVARLATPSQGVCQIAGPLRDRGPPAVPEASRLLVLPVAARRWVSIDNTSKSVEGEVSSIGAFPIMVRTK